MATYIIQPKENSDYCHFVMASEKEHGLQCYIFRDSTKAKDFAGQQYSVVKTLWDNKPIKDICFLQVSPPGKPFELFDKEKYKIVLPAKAYFKLLDFFQTEWPSLQKRIESDFQNIKSRKDWIPLCSFLSFQGEASFILYKLPLDVTPNATGLELVILKRGDSGKTNISLNYTDESLGSMHLPLQQMLQFAQHLHYVSSLFNYKEPAPVKRSRQS